MTLTTRSAGSLVSVILNRKGALSRAVRESRDYDSAVRVRILTVRWTVATIEVAAYSISPILSPELLFFNRFRGLFFSPGYKMAAISETFCGRHFVPQSQWSPGRFTHIMFISMFRTDEMIMQSLGCI